MQYIRRIKQRSSDPAKKNRRQARGCKGSSNVLHQGAYDQTEQPRHHDAAEACLRTSLLCIISVDLPNLDLHKSEKIPPRDSGGI